MKSYAPSEKSGGGTELKETVLWTNSAPNVDFASQTITLSDSIENYKYVMIVAKTSKSNNTQESDIWDVETFKTFNNSTKNAPIGIIGFVADSNVSYANVRRIGYVSNNQIFFSGGVFISATGGNNQWVIPLVVYGLK